MGNERFFSNILIKKQDGMTSICQLSAKDAKYIEDNYVEELDEFHKDKHLSIYAFSLSDQELKDFIAKIENFIYNTKDPSIELSFNGNFSSLSPSEMLDYPKEYNPIKIDVTVGFNRSSDLLLKFGENVIVFQNEEIDILIPSFKPLKNDGELQKFIDDVMDKLKNNIGEDVNLSEEELKREIDKIVGELPEGVTIKTYAIPKGVDVQEYLKQFDNIPQVISKDVDLGKVRTLGSA